MAFRLKEERARLGLTQKSLIENCSVTKQTVIRWESGAPVPSDKLEIMESIGFDIYYIVTGNKNFTYVNSQLPSINDNYTSIPVMNVEASAGAGCEVVSEISNSSLIFCNSWFKKRKLNKQNLAMITARDDSMLPTIICGESLVVDISSTENFVDAIYVLKSDGDLLVKRLQKQFAGGVKILSDNPSYETQFIPQDQLHNLHIVGRVVWMGVDL